MKISIADWRREILGDHDGPQFDRVEIAVRSGLIERDDVIQIGADHDHGCKVFDFQPCTCRPDVIVVTRRGAIRLGPDGRIAGCQ